MSYIKNYLYVDNGDSEDLTSNLFVGKKQGTEYSFFESLHDILNFDDIEVLREIYYMNSIQLAITTILNNIKLNDKVKNVESYVEFYKDSANDISGIVLSITIDFGTKELYDEHVFESKIK